MRSPRVVGRRARRLFVRTTADSRGGDSGVVLLEHEARVQNARFISQLARTKANLNVEWPKRFEGVGWPALAPWLRLRSASAPPPLRLHCASCLLLASLAPPPSASVAVAGRAAARHTSSPSRMRWECTQLLHQANLHRMHAWAVTWRAFRLSCYRPSAL